MPPTILHETSWGFGKAQQVNELVRTYNWRTPTPPYPSTLRKIRVTVHTDSHTEQSRYLAEVWTGSRWNEVVRVPGEDTLVAKLILSPYKPAETEPDKREGAEAMAEVLLARAQQVLR